MSGGVEEQILKLRDRYVARLGEKLDALDTAVRELCRSGTGASRVAELAARVREDAASHGFEDLVRVCQELHDLVKPFGSSRPPSAVTDGAALLVHEAQRVLQP